MKVKKPVLIVLGEPNSVFIEILSKALNKNSIKRKINYPIIIIGSKNLFRLQDFLNVDLNIFGNIVYIYGNKEKVKKT